LHHLGWAIRETERTRPSVGLLMRMVEQPIEVGGYHLPTGWLVQVAPGQAHLLPELFSNPEQYDPLRYAPGREEDKQHRFALIGFAGGVHKCAVMNLANMDMTILTALLLQPFDLQPLTPTPAVEHGLGASRPTPTRLHYRRKQLTPIPQPVAQFSELALP